MVLIRAVAALILAFILVPALPASAHENHQQTRAEKASSDGSVAVPGVTPGAMHELMEEHAETMAARRPKTFAQRLTSWLGRTHPFAVHFPIALFPVALVALVLARRRGEATTLIRALIIVAGAAAMVAAMLGWLTAGFQLVDRDWTHLWHRWIGTGLGLSGGLVAWWAWRSRASIDSTAMVVVLGMITAALLVQGWLGAAIVHGMEHMLF